MPLPDAHPEPSPVQLERAALVLRARVPPGRSLIGGYPLEMFRPDTIVTRAQPGLFVFIDLDRQPCDGSRYRAAERLPTITVGQLFVLDVLNDTPEPQPLELSVWGFQLPPEVSGVTTYREGEIPHQLAQGQLSTHPAPEES